MLPTSHELSATLFVELPDMQNIRDDLSAVKSAPHNILLRVGDDLVASRELIDPDETPPSEETHSVHFLRFALTDEQRDTFRNPDVAVTVRVDHPHYADEVEIDGDTRKSLIADLALNG